MRKKLLIGVGVIVLISIVMLFTKGKACLTFFEKYQTYVTTDIEHQAELFENIIGGICGGIVTFLALYITIKHENKKDQRNWKNERIRAKEERLLSVRPLLNIQCQRVSSIRNEKYDSNGEQIVLGKGKYHRYAKISISNQGFGKCNRIYLEDRKCSVDHLDVDEEKDLTIYLVGFDLESQPSKFSMTFRYQNIFGNTYTQKFLCSLNKEKQEMDISIGEPLLKEEE